jgi:hypothetical protein
MIALIAALLAASAGALANGPTGTGLDQCPQIPADKDRLACFDREFAALARQKSSGVAESGTAKQSAKTTSPGPAPAPTAPPTLTPEQAMGLPPEKILRLQQPQQRTELKELTAKIQGVSVRSSGRALFTLENGQVWQQVESDPGFEVQPGETVHITKALWGSYLMTANSHRSTRVSRAQ